MVKEKEAGSVVKIDPILLEKVNEFIRKEENRFRYSNKKQFIDIAVYEFLDKMENGKGGRVGKNGK